MARKTINCKYCNDKGCHGECTNYILAMMDHNAGREEIDRLLKEIPKFNYILSEKINAIFGTDLEVAQGSKSVADKTEEFEKFLYSANANGNTNLYEIKKAIKEKEIFGEGYLFFDTENVYALAESEISSFQEAEEDPIIDNILYYTVGDVSVPEELKFPEAGFIKQEAGYIIAPSNLIKFKSDTYALNSDLKQLQILLEINRKIFESTTRRDYGDLYFFTTEPKGGLVSAVANVANRIKNTANEAIKKMRQRIADSIKENKVDDSNVVVFDETYKDMKQAQPITKVTDYKFIWDKQDNIVSSVLNFPMLLAGLGDEAGNVSKEALLKEARANTLTPIKADTANSLSMIAKKLFGEEYYLRFQDYSEVNADFEETPKKVTTQTEN
jgi:hypothetical protein